MSLKQGGSCLRQHLLYYLILTVPEWDWGHAVEAQWFIFVATPSTLPCFNYFRMKLRTCCWSTVVNTSRSWSLRSWTVRGSSAMSRDHSVFVNSSRTKSTRSSYDPRSRPQKECKRIVFNGSILNQVVSNNLQKCLLYNVKQDIVYVPKTTGGNSMLS